MYVSIYQHKYALISLKYVCTYIEHMHKYICIRVYVCVCIYVCME